jgi:hypothetical protein
MVPRLVRTRVRPADEPASCQHFFQATNILLRTQELSDTEMTRGASNEDRLNELCEPEPLVGVVDKPCGRVSFALFMCTRQY